MIKMRQGLSGVLFAALAIALAGIPALSYSQVLEEIIVTAQKREQNLQDVGIAVTAFSGDLIRELGFTNTTDVASMTPGLNYTVPNAESSQINFFLRGVGLNDFADANENPVAVYVDDVYRPAMGGLSFQLFDMERVEVLRGYDDFLWNLSMPYLLATLADFDIRGRMVVHGVSMQFIGYAVGPAIAAQLLGFGYGVINTTAAILFVAAALLLLLGVMAQREGLRR